jgi:hypothetical protein
VGVNLKSLFSPFFQKKGKSGGFNRLGDRLGLMARDPAGLEILPVVVI